jgi:hypothetical protein
MKSLLALFAIALLSVSVIACGGASKGTGSTSRDSSNAAATGGTPATTPSSTATTEASAADAVDGDFVTPQDRNDDGEVLEYGHPAGPADKQTVTAIVKRYLAAAAAEDGATACSLIISNLAKLIPKNYGRPQDSSYMLGKTCAMVMSKLFKHFHQELVTQAAGLEVTSVRVRGNNADALLAFRTMPELWYMTAEREGVVWKINELIDAKFP